MKATKLLIIASLFLVQSCEGLFTSAPTVTYSETNLDATFFEAGNSSAPTVDWGGAQGSFSITQNIDELSINSTNGVVSWTNQLAPGMLEFDVLASNSSGQVSIPMAIDNAFQGTFTGTYSGSTFFEMEFSADGTVIVRANSSTDPTVGTGIWTMDEDFIIVNYTYPETEEDYSVGATLTWNASQASLDGDWYIGHDNTDGTSSGSVEIVME